MKTHLKYRESLFAAAAILFLLTGTSLAELANNSLGAKSTPIPDESCQGHIERHHSGSPYQIRASLKEEFAAYLPLVEQSLVYREESIRLAAKLKAKIAARKPLNGEDLDTLNRGTIAHLELRKKLYRLAEAHECWTRWKKEDFREKGIGKAERLEGVMLSLSAAMVLYDNYLLAISIFDEDEKLRRFLNERDSGYNINAAQLAKITISYNSAYNRQRVRSGIYFYEKELEKAPPSFLEDEDRAYLNTLITQSPSYNMTKEFSPLYVLGRKVRFLSAMTTDTLNSLGKDGVNLFSMIFGNTLGLIESRKGKLYGRFDVLEKLEQELRAGDILLEKTPFRLTDKFIPGHWGHVAIWIGTEEELKALGIWDHAVVQKYHEQIQSGRSVVEALRPGVEMNRLTRFLNIDDIAVIRGKEMTKKEKGETIIRALRQVGKEYDFNFDVETTDKIVCSELVYTTFTGIKWPTGKTLGRITISPDNVASIVINGGPLKLALLYHDGKLVKKGPLRQMASLMTQ
ncbi:MAG: YiiX/YebB-like N1pC/P60 family cysteine hydrolase [Deltaproteobacteria bacterium]|nr:YiiX/YebB-like N1pC/P60 family cysteine hydrolase [Deltaproteobacteria bacterium]